MRKFAITVNGKSYEVEVEEIGQGGASIPSFSSPAAGPAPSPSPAPTSKPSENGTAPKAPAGPVPQGTETVKAPMPGSIVDIMVKPGDQVAKGQVLVILEAMKMENEIMCPRDAKIVSVQVAKGSSVNAGDVLVAIE